MEQSDPGTLPPPSNLASKRIDASPFEGSLFRTHNALRHPVYFGKTGLYRFDAPDGSYGVLYAGLDPFCAFIESFLKNPDHRVVTTATLKAKALAELKPARALRLIDLTTPGALLRIGADARLFSGEYRAAQLWSGSLHDHPVEPDGILYPSRMDPTRQSVALFEDRAPKLVELDRQSWYAPGPRRLLLAEIAERYQVELIESQFVAPRKPIAGAVNPRLFDGGSE